MARRTSKKWWSEVKNDSHLFLDWLQDQYHGEVTAHRRILDFARTYVPPESPWRGVLETIAAQELTHAAWVGELLEARGLTAKVLNKDERYWERTLPAIDSFESGAAVAAHAEQMRLERIEVIANDPTAPVDARSVFKRILPQERFHARAFSRMAGHEAMAQALAKHELGMEAIGLIPASL